MKKISIVVPIYNEEENVVELHREVKNICEKNKYIYEIIFIDDGSTDKTAELIKKLEPVKYIRLRKNFGQTAAMDAGIKNAKYDYIITMDGDRQNDPDDIPELINYLEKNECDIVSGWRKKRKDNFLKKFVSRGANLMRKIIINDGIHDSGCSLKIYRKECFENVTLFGEMHRFIPAILKIKGFKIGEVVVNHRPRTAGRTKYNWKRTIKGFIDMIAVWFWNKYSARPLHLMGGVGFLLIFLGTGLGVATVILKFVFRKPIANSSFPLLTALLIITGVQFFISGLISDMLSKNYYRSTNDSAYSIKEIVEKQKKQNKKK